MGSQSGPTEGGSGGKWGHSNMAHRDLTAVIKSNASRRRRTADQAAIREQVADDGSVAPDEQVGSTISAEYPPE